MVSQTFQVEGVPCEWHQVQRQRTAFNGQAIIEPYFFWGPVGGRYEVDDLSFLAQQLIAFPKTWRNGVFEHYLSLFRSFGRANANRRLRELSAQAKDFPIRIGADAEEVRQKAANMADHCLRARTLSEALQWCAYMQIAPPDGKTEDGTWNRLRDKKWWRRRLLTAHAKNIDQFAREQGLIHQRRQIYVSDSALALVTERRRHARRVLEQCEAVNELGEAYTLAELQDLSVSNPVLRRNEMMTRLSGIERLARDAGHAAVFLTITCPSRFHAVHSKSGDRNLKFDGSTPRDGAEYLNAVWANTRRHFNQRGITIYGIRVREPQQDGTPHDHLLLFAPATQINEVIRISRSKAHQESPDEPGAATHRFDVKRIDYAKGTATGYVAKYVSKNVDGYGVDADLFGNDAKSSAVRAGAWASVWGIRQFQFFGTAPVCVWRELRRVANADTHPELTEAILAADAGDWAAFTKAVDTMPLQLLYLWSDELGEYGEPVGNTVLGVTAEDGQHAIVTRHHQWSIRRMMDDQSSETAIRYRKPGNTNQGEAAGGGPGSFPPWSSVNNCTKAISSNAYTLEIACDSGYFKGALHPMDSS